MLKKSNSIEGNQVILHQHKIPVGNTYKNTFLKRFKNSQFRAMAKFYTKLTTRLQNFIRKQKIFFVATAPKEGRINLPPKGMDSLRVVDENRILWLNVTGSGNETAAHLLENQRITIMMCSFDVTPSILRIYEKGRAIHPFDQE